MSSSIAQAINIALDSDIQPWDQCQPAEDFDVFSIRHESHTPTGLQIPTSTLISQSINNWVPSREHRLEIANVPIIAGRHASKIGVRSGNIKILQDLFERMKIPESVLSCFLDNRIQFTSFPSQYDELGVYLLNFRQWCIAWRYDKRNGSSKAILLWMAGSWAKVGISDWLQRFLKFLTSTDIGYDTPGLLAVLLCTRNVAESLAALDEEAFHTERRLRQLIQDGRLKQEDELGRMSAAHSWLAARCIRERERVNAATSFLEHTLDNNALLLSPSATHHSIPDADVKALRLLTASLSAHALKLRDESSMHLSTIYNLIAQKDQATSLAIAGASRELALQSKVDQANSLKIAEASMRIAEDTRRDSNAMKVITVVTMLYLPGTFVATCFSMGIFQWSEPASTVVNPRIWVYFLFTGLLTILTIGGFFGWMWWQGRRMRRESIEAQATAPSKDVGSPSILSAGLLSAPEKSNSKVQTSAVKPSPQEEPLESKTNTGRKSEKPGNLPYGNEDVSLPNKKAAKLPEVLLQVPAPPTVRSASPFRIDQTKIASDLSMNRAGSRIDHPVSPTQAGPRYETYTSRLERLSRREMSRSPRRPRSRPRYRENIYRQPQTLEHPNDMRFSRRKLYRARSRPRYSSSDSFSAFDDSGSRERSRAATMIRRRSPDLTVDHDHISGRSIFTPSHSFEPSQPPFFPVQTVQTSVVARRTARKRRSVRDHSDSTDKALRASNVFPLTWDVAPAEAKEHLSRRPPMVSTDPEEKEKEEAAPGGRYNLDINHLATSKTDHPQNWSSLVDYLHSSQAWPGGWSQQQQDQRHAPENLTSTSPKDQPSAAEHKSPVSEQEPPQDPSPTKGTGGVPSTDEYLPTSDLHLSSGMGTTDDFT